jgi:hypothetical protein
MHRISLKLKTKSKGKYYPDEFRKSKFSLVNILHVCIRYVTCVDWFQVLDARVTCGKA